MALLNSPRVKSIILINAVGIEVPNVPVVDFFSLTLDQVFDRSYHNPDKFRINPANLPPAAQAIFASNRATLAVYGGKMVDPGLARRLAIVKVPALVLWGESDQIVDADYGRAYAAAIPGAKFQLLTETGHVPFIETPDKVIGPVCDFANAHVAPSR